MTCPTVHLAGALATLVLVAGCHGSANVAQIRDADHTSATAGTPTSRPSVRFSDLGSPIQVIGPLDQPLGKLITIEGKPVPQSARNGRWSRDIAKNLFSVENVNGKKLPQPRWIQLQFPPFRFPNGQPELLDRPYTFEGYQDGGFVNEPEEAMEAIGLLYATSGWHFEVVFVVVERPKP